MSHGGQLWAEGDSGNTAAARPVAMFLLIATRDAWPMLYGNASARDLVLLSVETSGVRHPDCGVVEVEAAAQSRASSAVPVGEPLGRKLSS